MIERERNDGHRGQILASLFASDRWGHKARKLPWAYEQFGQP
jgi:hypothetical protein